MNSRGIKIGDEIFYSANSVDISTIRTGIVTKMRSDNLGGYIFTDNQHKPEDCIYDSYCFPIKYLDEFKEIVEKRAKLKKEFEDSMSLIYQLNNKVHTEAQDD